MWSELAALLKKLIMDVTLVTNWKKGALTTINI